MGMGTLIILLACGICFYFLLLLFKFLYKEWWNPLCIRHLMAAQGIKGPPYRFLKGNTIEIMNMRSETRSKPMNLSHDIFPYILPHMHSWLKIYGMNYVSWHGSKALLVVTEPELIKEILSNRDGEYPKTKIQGYLKKMFGDGLLISEGKKWIKHRKLANHAFHAESLKNMVPAMITSVEMMLEKWRHQEGKEIEVFEEFKVMTSDVISRTAFGSSYLEGKNIFEMLMKMAVIASRNADKIRLPGIGKILKTEDDIESDKLQQGIEESVMQIIKTRKEKVKRGQLDGYGCDYLGLLVKASHDADESKKISIEDMIDECKTFYIAGHETTVSLLSWTVLLLAIHTDWQEKARKEVYELFGKRNPDPDDNGIARLKIMNMIVNESLRLYPPVISFIRRVAKEARVGELIIPKDIEVMIPIFPAHLDHKIWGEDAHLFKPERFSEGVAKATKNSPTAFLPFGLGPRTCVGFNFATIEAKLALSMILQRYSFTLSPAYIHSPIQVLTSRPQHGIQIMLQPV